MQRLAVETASLMIVSGLYRRRNSMTYVWHYSTSVNFVVKHNKGDKTFASTQTESVEKRKYALEETDRPWE